MNYLRYWKKRLISSLIISCLVLSSQIHAQTDKNEAKLQNLNSRITMAESKLAAAELKLFVADSLITNGDLSINKAEEKFARIGEEQKESEKEYRTNTKTLNKLAKSKDEGTAQKAEDDLKALNAKYKEDTKLKEAEIKELTRQANKAKSDIEKGLDMQKAANLKIKDAQKALEIARKNYEAFVETLDSESNK